MTLDVTDRMALGDLVHRYAAGVDDRRFDDVVAMFAESATLSVPAPPQSLEPVDHHRGHGAIRDAIAAVTAAARTEHAIVGEVYFAGPGPDRASGRISCVAHHWSTHENRITDVVWHLRYDDAYVRIGAAWRFRSRELTINAIETRPVRRLRPD
jgi:hypothetical protein